MVPVLAVGHPARGEPTAEEKETARRLFGEGNDRYGENNYAAALMAYLAADAIMGVPTTGFKVGRALAALGRLIEARDKLLAVGRIPAAPNEPDPLANARRDAAALAAELRGRIPTLVVEVVGPGPDVTATISLDGRQLRPELAGIAQSLDPGEHRIRVSAPGFAPAERLVALREREHGSVTVTLKAAAPDGPAPDGSTPDGPAPDDSGASGRAATALLWTGFGLGAAGIAVGTATGVVSLSAAGRLHDACNQTTNVCPAASRDDLDTASTFAPISDIAFIVASVGVTAGVIGLVLTFTSGDAPASGEAQAVTLTPYATARGAGVTGTF